jgi:hypothetical protein
MIATAGEYRFMELLTMEESSSEGSMSSWLRVASDPSQAVALHAIFGDFCHQYRNNLHALKLSLYLARKAAKTSDASIWDQFDPGYAALERLVDRLQTIYRPMELDLVRLPLEMLVAERRRSWIDGFVKHGRSLDLEPPATDTIGYFDPIRLAMGLEAFVTWRAGAGEPGRPARLTWKSEGDNFHLVWSEPGARAIDALDELKDQREPLALPLLARIISAHQGTVELASDDGLKVHLRWPRSGRPT